MNYATARRIARVARKATGEKAPKHYETTHIAAQAYFEAIKVNKAQRRARKIMRRGYA